MTETSVLQGVAVKDREAVQELEKRIRRFVGMAVGSLGLAAAGLGASVIFIPAGMFLAMVAVIVGVVGLTASYIVPRVMLRFK